ncbi:MAG: hypothetical protein P8Q94_05490 [Candidatus Poseidoniaceae archaeon]|nr:hypothetical protein [Candidatus Poseidoniaceae archaeon]
MSHPDLILRKQLMINESRNISFNLLNLNCWPLWNKFANRILSEQQGLLQENQRFDLHRIIAQQLVEDLWQVSQIKSSEEPCFAELRLTWIGQKINGRTSALAIRRLIIEITVLETENGGVEISAWWDISKLGRLLRFGKRFAKAIVSQLFEDLSSHGIIEYQQVSENE